MTAPHFRFYVTYRDRHGDHDAAHIWAADHVAAVERARWDANWIERSLGKHECGPDDWDAVRLPGGRTILRAEYEKELAA